MIEAKRRALVALAAGAPFLGIATPWVRAQGRMPRIGYLLLLPLDERPSRERLAFIEGLRSHGYVLGKNIEIIYASAQNAAEFMVDVCHDLLAQKVDVIVASGGVAVMAAKKCTTTVPVVIQALGDPVGVGAVRSLSPAAKRIGVLWDTRNPNASAESTATIAAVKRIGMKAEPTGVASDADLRRFFAQLAKNRPDALYVAFEAGMVGTNRTYIAQAALEQRIPVVSGWSFLTEAGGLVSYAPDIAGMFRRSASYVHRILKGAKPAELPIELPRNVELVVNLKTAKALGITIPHAFLVRADRVIE